MKTAAFFLLFLIMTLAAAFAQDEAGLHDLKGLQQAIEQDPTSSLFRERLGDYYFDRQEYRLAQNQFQTAVSLNPTDVYARFRLGISHELAGETAEAVHVYSEALNWSSSLIQFRLALCYAKVGKDEQAIRLLNQVKEIHDSPGIHYALALSHSKLKHYGQAEKEMDAALNRDPQFEFGEAFFQNRHEAEKLKQELERKQRRQKLEHVLVSLGFLAAVILYSSVKLFLSRKKHQNMVLSARRTLGNVLSLHFVSLFARNLASKFAGWLTHFIIEKEVHMEGYSTPRLCGNDRRASGTTLFELIIGMALFSLILSFVFSALNTSHLTMAASNRQLPMEFNLQSAMDRAMRFIRQSADVSGSGSLLQLRQWDNRVKTLAFAKQALFVDTTLLQKNIETANFRVVQGSVTKFVTITLGSLYRDPGGTVYRKRLVSSVALRQSSSGGASIQPPPSPPSPSSLSPSPPPPLPSPPPPPPTQRRLSEDPRCRPRSDCVHPIHSWCSGWGCPGW